MPPLTSNASDNVKKQAAREVIDILHEIAVLLVCFVFVGEWTYTVKSRCKKSSLEESTKTRKKKQTNKYNEPPLEEWIC